MMNISSRLKLAGLLLVAIGLLTDLFIRQGSEFLRAGEDYYNQATHAKERNLKNARLAGRLIEGRIDRLRIASQAIAHLTPEHSLVEKNGRVEHFLKWQTAIYPKEGISIYYPNGKDGFRPSSDSHISPEMERAFKETHWTQASFLQNAVLISPVNELRFAIAFQMADSHEDTMFAFTYLDFEPNFFDGIDSTSELHLYSDLAAKEFFAKNPKSIDAYSPIPNTGIGIFSEFKPIAFDHFEPILTERTKMLGACIFLLALGLSFILFGRNDWVEVTEAQAAKEIRN